MNKPLHVVKWQGKEYPLPCDLDLTLDLQDELIDVENRISGETAALPWFAVAVYDLIIGAELLEDYDLKQKGLDWFLEHFPD